jgi:hypothetical protein
MSGNGELVIGNWQLVIDSFSKLSEVSGSKDARPQCVFSLLRVAEFGIPHLYENLYNYSFLPSSLFLLPFSLFLLPSSFVL